MTRNDIEKRAEEYADRNTIGQVEYSGAVNGYTAGYIEGSNAQLDEALRYVIFNRDALTHSSAMVITARIETLNSVIEYLESLKIPNA